jgi:hypothetical protein
MARVALGLVLVATLLLASPAAAVICATDAVPAATLLLPYFEVDLNNPNGLTTLFSVNNASATAALVHVVIWSDLSVPVLDFNIYLTGYDVQSVNLRDIIINGNMPQTASAGQDPNDTISPKGPLSQDINFASCTGILPPPALPGFFIAHLQAALTGKASAVLGGLCAGQNLGDNIARGYVTMDTVNSCSLQFVGDVGYLANTITFQNILWGDWFIVNAAQNFAEGGDLVHVEASLTDPATTTSGRYTFYGRYTTPPFTATDHREPLATNFAVRYLNGGPFSGGTSLLVWRDSKVNQGPFVCPAVLGARPPWYPLGQEGITIFDEQEHPQVPTTTPFSPQPPNIGIIPFPAETQRTQVGGSALPVPFNFGWIYLNLNTTVAQAPGLPPVDPAAAQAWVVYTLASNGHFAVGIDAIRLDSACAALHFNPGSISSSLRFKESVEEMGAASDGVLKLRLAQEARASSLLGQVQEQHAAIEEQSARIAVHAGLLERQGARIAAQQRQLEQLALGQAAVDDLRLQVEQLSRTVEAQQAGADRRP